MCVCVCVCVCVSLLNSITTFNVKCIIIKKILVVVFNL